MSDTVLASDAPRRLTSQEEIFAQAAITMSYADAYRIAWGDSDNDGSRWAAPSRVAWRPHVQQRIIELQNEASKKLKVDRDWLLNWWWLRMVYDPAELTAWASGACRHCYGDGHAFQWRTHEFMDRVARAELSGEPLPDIGGGFGYNAQRPPHPGCTNCDGKGIGRADFTDTTLLSPSARAAFEGVEQTRDGIKIRMADKVKAAENFAKLSGFDVQQVRLFVDELPDDPALAAQARDTDAIAATYKRFFGPSHRLQ
jgi:phage terminase small subunit